MLFYPYKLTSDKYDRNNFKPYNRNGPKTKYMMRTTQYSVALMSVVVTIIPSGSPFTSDLEFRNSLNIFTAVQWPVQNSTEKKRQEKTPVEL